jgi:chromate transporter
LASENDGENSPPSGPPAAGAIGLGAIFTAFLRLGSISFGGGTTAWLYREMVQRRAWLDDKTFLSALALSQIMPGANSMNLAALVGQRLRGAKGAAAAALGLVAAPFAIVLALAILYGDIGPSARLHAVLGGVAVGAIGLTFATGLRIVAQGPRSLAPLAVTGATVLAVGVLGWPILPVLLVLAPCSIGLALATGRHGQRRR